MRLKSYVLVISLISVIGVMAMLTLSAWWLTSAANSYAADAFNTEITETTTEELRKQASIVFAFVGHLLNSEGLNPSNIQETLENLVDVPVVLLDGDGHLISDPETTPDSFFEQNQEMLTESIRTARVNRRFEIVVSGGPNAASVYRYRIFPDRNLVVGVGSDYRLSLARFRFFQSKTLRFGTKLILRTLLALAIVVAPLAFALYLFLTRSIVSPLFDIEKGLRSLKGHDFGHRLSIRAATELESISESFNETAKELESSYGLIARQERRYKTLIENIPQKVFLKDTSSRYVSCNRAFANDLGTDPERIVGKSDADFFSPEVAEKYVLDDRRILAKGIPEEFDEQFLVDGKASWVHTVKSPVFDEANKPIGILGVFFDITEQREKEETIRELNDLLERKVRERTRELEDAYRKMEELSVTDALTGLHNRRYFAENADIELRKGARKGERAGIIMLDIDFFKAYNDTYGHQAGDEALRTVAECVHLVLQRPGDLAARYGGEEFVLFLPDTEEQGLVTVAESVRGAVERRNIAHSKSEAAPVLTVSLGSALGKGDGSDNIQALIAAADRALYQAKGEGRNRHIQYADTGESTSGT